MEIKGNVGGKMSGRFKNRVAVVTGGSQGIGFSIAKLFAEEGANVALFDINEEALQTAKSDLEKCDGQVVTFVVDVTSSEAVDQTLEKVNAKFGSIDIVVNNAGILRDNLLFKMSDGDWQQVLDVHLNGTFNVSRAAQKYMVEQKYGRIINISSISALGNRGQTNYATAKAGIQGFTKSLAIELGPFGITTNCVAPGFIETEMTRKTAERVGISFEEFVAKGIEQIPVRRVGKPEDIAHAVAFFAKESSSFVNGQVLYVAGGPKD